MKPADSPLMVPVGLAPPPRVDPIPGAAMAVLVAGCAAVVGLMWPDVDLRLGIGHRHGFTHSPLLPALLLLVAARWRRMRTLLLLAAAGLAVGIAIHCAADLFPRGMRGYATIKLPLVDGIGRPASYAWLTLTVAAGFILPLLAVERRFGASAVPVAAAGAAVLAFAYFTLHDEPPEMALAIGAGLGLTHPAGRRALVQRLISLRRSRSRMP